MTMQAALDRLAARVRTSAARAIVALINDAPGVQVAQVTTLADTVRDAERLQNYGLTSVPLPGAEGVALALGGSTDHTVVICVDDRRYRLKGLTAGEVALYDDLGHRVHLTRTGIVINGGGHPVTITNTPKMRIEGAVEATGGITDLCDSGGKSMSQMRQTYNGHDHNETGDVTDGPNNEM